MIIFLFYLLVIKYKNRAKRRIMFPVSGSKNIWTIGSKKSIKDNTYFILIIRGIQRRG